MEIEAVADYDEDGEVSRSSSEEDVVSGTVTMKCHKCGLICLPEAFGNIGPNGLWPKPYRDGSNGWYVTQGAEIECYGITIRGRAYLDAEVGELYSEMYRAHMCNSLAELPQFLANELPGIQDLALRRMEELENEENRNNRHAALENDVP